jgi:hypothetical protein
MIFELRRAKEGTEQGSNEVKKQLLRFRGSHRGQR